MKKKVIILLIFLQGLIFNLNAQHGSINFEYGKFQELKDKAIKENKLIFINAYTSWCAPCKWMLDNIFTNDTIADFYNSNFINTKIDMEKDEEGIELARKYNVIKFPSLLFIDGNGNLQHRMVGGMNLKEFYELSKNAKNKEQNLAFYQSNYENNKSDMNFLQKYIKVLDKAGLDFKEQLILYFSLQKDEDMFKHENWEMIEDYSYDIDSREFKYLISNKKKFDKLYSEHEVNEKVDQIHCYALLSLLRVKPFDQVKYERLKNLIGTSNLANAKRTIFDAELIWAKESKDWDSFARLANLNLDKYYSKDADILNDTAWDYFIHVTDSTSLAKAEIWSKLAIGLNPSYPNMDTYASILYKNGKIEIAKKMANKAIQIAKNNGLSESDYQATSDLLKKMAEN